MADQAVDLTEVICTVGVSYERRLLDGRTIDLARGKRTDGHCCCATTANASTGAPATGGSARLGNERDSGPVHPHMLPAAFIVAALGAGVPVRDAQVAARTPFPSPAPPRSATDAATPSTNHAACIVSAFVIGC